MPHVLFTFSSQYNSPLRDKIPHKFVNHGRQTLQYFEFYPPPRRSDLRRCYVLGVAGAFKANPCWRVTYVHVLDVINNSYILLSLDASFDVISRPYRQLIYHTAIQIHTYVIV